MLFLAFTLYAHRNSPLTIIIDHRRTRILRDLGLPATRDELVDLLRYPRGLSYPPYAYDVMQCMAILEGSGARRLREELEFSRMAPILRDLGRTDFTGIGYGGLGWGRLGDGLGLGNPLQDRLYGSLLNGGLGGWNTMSNYLMPFMMGRNGLAGHYGELGGMGGMSPYLSGGIGALGGYPGYTGIGALAGGRRGLGLGGRYNAMMGGVGGYGGYGGYGGGLGGLGGLARYGRSFLT